MSGTEATNGSGVRDRASWNDAYDAVPLDLGLVPDPRLVALLGDLPPGHGLELGCGEGRPSVWLATRGWSMTAVDFSRVAIQRARRLAGAQEVVVDWRCADVDARIQVDDPLDLVLVSYLHVEPAVLTSALASAAADLAPAGSLVILGWDRSNAERGTGGPRPAELLYDADEIAAALPGLTVRSAERVWQDHEGGASDLVLCASRT